MDRRKFLKTAGSLAIGGVFASVVGGGVWKLFNDPDELFFDSNRQKGLDDLVPKDETFVSPYRRTFGFLIPAEATALDVDGGSLFIASSDHIYIYGLSGQIQKSFAVEGGDVRSLALYDGKIYVLFPSSVGVYNRQGELLHQWNACSDNSNYCSLAVGPMGVFVTDVANKNVCHYRLDGSFARFINSPSGFIIPSMCFGIAIIGDALYCSNPGRHLVEKYSFEGEFMASFGSAGATPGSFCGCCNPAVITSTANGEIITSEKGIPRISCYDVDGNFRGVLLDTEALGGGHAAYMVRLLADKLVVVMGNKVSIFQYNRSQSQLSACGQCVKPCPLKANI